MKKLRLLGLGLVAVAAIFTTSCTTDCAEELVCVNGISTTDADDNCACDCADGWEGETCADSIDCAAEITCVNGTAAFIDTTCGCECEVGYFGETCDEAYATAYAGTSWSASEICDEGVGQIDYDFSMIASANANAVVVKNIGGFDTDDYEALFVIDADEVMWDEQDLGDGLTLYAGTAIVSSSTAPRTIEIGYTIVDGDGVEVTCSGTWTQK